MNAVRIRKHLDSDTIQVSGLKGMIGKDVEIIILAEGEDQRVQKPQKRTPGSAKGMITVKEGFEKPLDEKAVKGFYQ